MKLSKQFEWNRADTIAWAKNALWFLAPTLLVLLASITEALPPSWKYTAIVIYILNRLTDAIRRYYAGK
jgi:hypothetical protein